MNAIEISTAINFCKKRCRSHDRCHLCKNYSLSNGCEALYMSDLYDIIDTKTLEHNNIKDLIRNINEQYFEMPNPNELLCYQYSILELFTDNRYILTKKKNYNKLIKCIYKEDL